MLVPAGGLGMRLEAGQLRHDLVGCHRGLRLDFRARDVHHRRRALGGALLEPSRSRDEVGKDDGERDERHLDGWHRP